MFLKLAYLPSKLCFLGKYLFKEHQISVEQLSANSSWTETLYCVYRNLHRNTHESLGEVDKAVKTFASPLSMRDVRVSGRAFEREAFPTS